MLEILPGCKILRQLRIWSIKYGRKSKILEAMASALPVVTTTVGAEGLGVKNGDQALITDNLGDLVQSTVEVLRNPELAKKLGNSGRKFVEKNYTWYVSAEKL